MLKIYENRKNIYGLSKLFLDILSKIYSKHNLILPLL